MRQLGVLALLFLTSSVRADHSAAKPDGPAKMLGAVLLASGEPAEAEQVFRAELATHPRSGRSLFGLRESLKAQKKEYAARLVDREFQTAWKNAEQKELRLEDSPRPIPAKRQR
ncbi:MAG: hypothetical protein ACYC3I_11605 [Gemmataceae bacterium]